jgi:parvulin-like peptidyl-prolyl isomerase
VIPVRRLLIPVLAVSLAAAACSDTGDERVATVDGVAITVDDVRRYLQVEDRLALDEAFQRVVSEMIASRSFERAFVDEFGELDRDDIDARYRVLLDDLASQGLTAADGVGIRGAKDEILELRARFEYISDEVVADVAGSEEFLQSLLADPVATATVCVRHILSQSMEEIVDVDERIEGGEAFDDVAAELEGGDLGCQPASLYPVAFAEAALAADLGAVWGPFQSEVGFHLIIVDDRTVPTEAEITADPGSFVTEDVRGSVLNVWFGNAIGSSEISVEPRFGTWSATGLQLPSGG